MLRKVINSLQAILNKVGQYTKPVFQITYAFRNHKDYHNNNQIGHHKNQNAFYKKQHAQLKQQFKQTDGFLKKRVARDNIATYNTSNQNSKISNVELETANLNSKAVNQKSKGTYQRSKGYYQKSIGVNKGTKNAFERSKGPYQGQSGLLSLRQYFEKNKILVEAQCQAIVLQMAKDHLDFRRVSEMIQTYLTTSSYQIKVNPRSPQGIVKLLTAIWLLRQPRLYKYQAALVDNLNRETIQELELDSVGISAYITASRQTLRSTKEKTKYNRLLLNLIGTVKHNFAAIQPSQYNELSLIILKEDGKQQMFLQVVDQILNAYSKLIQQAIDTQGKETDNKGQTIDSKKQQNILNKMGDQAISISLIKFFAYKNNMAVFLQLLFQYGVSDSKQLYYFYRYLTQHFLPKQLGLSNSTTSGNSTIIPATTAFGKSKTISGIGKSKPAASFGQLVYMFRQFPFRYIHEGRQIKSMLLQWLLEVYQQHSQWHEEFINDKMAPHFASSIITHQFALLAEQLNYTYEGPFTCILSNSQGTFNSYQQQKNDNLISSYGHSQHKQNSVQYKLGPFACLQYQQIKKNVPVLPVLFWTIYKHDPSQLNRNCFVRSVMQVAYPDQFISTADKNQLQDSPFIDTEMIIRTQLALQLLGVKVVGRQVAIASRFVDFLLEDNIILQIDGLFHLSPRQAQTKEVSQFRNMYLTLAGYKLLLVNTYEYNLTREVSQLALLIEQKLKVLKQRQYALVK